MADDQRGERGRGKPRLHVRILPRPAQIVANGAVSSSCAHNNPSSHTDTTRGDSAQAARCKGKASSGSARDSGTRLEQSSLKLPRRLQWVSANWTWSRWKPALRSAVSAWVALVIFVIPSVENVLGQAAFLILIASFLSAPSDPLVAVVERECIILLFAGLGWAWECLALKFADLARTVHVTDPTTTSVVSGQYLQTAPSVILAVFFFFGSTFYMYVRARQGPGPFLFASIMGCLGMDISFITAALYPYPYYRVGQTIMVPLAFHSAIALLTSILVFPSSISTVFTTRLQGVLSSLADAIKEHREHLTADVTSPNFSAAPITAAVDKAEEVLAQVAATRRLLKLDVIYCRIAPTDYNEIHQLARRLVIVANGLSVYYTLIDPTRERFPVTPAQSNHNTPSVITPVPSRPSSPDLPRSHTCEGSSGDVTHKPRRRPGSVPPSGSSSPHLFRRHSYKHSPHHSHHSVLHSRLLHISVSRNPRTESAVGVFESYRYLNLEATRFTHPEAEKYIARSTELLSMSCNDLLIICEAVLCESGDWLSHVREHRFDFWVNVEEKNRIREDRIQKFQGLLAKLSREIDAFTMKKRLLVLEPYRPMFDTADELVSCDDAPPHRYLFHCYVYQYHVMRFAATLQALLEEIIRLDMQRKRPKVWFPSLKLSKFAFWSTWEPSENSNEDDDENPETIPGLDPSGMTDLGQAVRRDPDALPPRNTSEAIMGHLYRMVTGLGGGNALFAIKGGVLSVILVLPSLIKSSATFAYENKFIWAVFMAQTTLARFRGDTVFGLVTRIFSTFVGGLLGTVIWYISTGSGRGNPYGLAGVCFVCFPLFFFVRLYWPVQPMTSIIIFVTAGLVIGYSYQDTHLPTSSSPGWGFDVAWRRFVLVAIGVIAAGVFSFFPPSTTIRKYQRRALATTVAELGSIYCSVISFASTRREDDITFIVQSLLAIRSKLKRSRVSRTNVMYEFSMRGKWPSKRYQKILDTQLQLSYLLSDLLSVVSQLNPAWARAFLKRTRLLDPDFQGDVLAVISLISTSLRTGNPLPQVTPSPLLDRFMEGSHGLNVVHQESEDDFGLPKHLSLDTLESLQYLTFCVGVSTAFAIVTRLDRLMITTKQLVGEQYHIDGIELPLHYRHKPTGIEMRSPTLSLRQP
ncbi:hypothetical protein BKA83DRAFT_4243292 [Pisolithus microcarpus]|nr:hypothetical protein BKA83DRAFT_4243292 [Pisolithus microcarpus]